MEQTKRQIKDYFKYVYYSHTPVEHTSILPTDNMGVALPNWNFWQDYISNTSVYDRRFYDMFGSYKYRELDDFIIESFEGHEYVDISLIEFKNSVVALLFSNAKKYEELYRMYSVSDSDYMLVDNYNVTEIMDRDTTGTLTDVSGSRNDSSTDKTSPYDTENFFNEGNSVITKGEQTDTSNRSGTENYTLTKKGNIGVQTGSDMLKKHKDLWSKYEFFDMIFKDIAKQLLSV